MGDELPGWVGLQLLQLLLQFDLHLHQLIILLHVEKADSKEMSFALYIHLHLIHIVLLLGGCNMKPLFFPTNNK